MASAGAAFDQLPPELLEFQTLGTKLPDFHARLGLLSLRERTPIHTPNYLAISSRGCVPHLTPDMMRGRTSIRGIYAGFEDYAEKLPKPLPLYSFPCPPSDSPLRRFIALQRDALLVLGPRRHPAIKSPTMNTYTSLNICTSVGFRQLEIPLYIEAVQKLRPDIVVGIADLEPGKKTPGVKRRDHMVERTRAWMKGIQTGISESKAEGNSITSLWAPILPIDVEVQRSYLEYLEEEAQPKSFGGIVLYSNGSVDAIPTSMRSLPRLAITDPKSPQEVLDSVSLGMDILTLPFITEASEAGIGLAFSFPAKWRNLEQERLPLGVNMWPVDHAKDMSPLVEGCTCYSCQSHPRAFLQHLLAAKEMLAWVLLQVHNHHIMDLFFEGVRASIAAGTFEENIESFQKAYTNELPEFTGQGPRIRGYQATFSGQSPQRKNKPAYKKLDGDRRAPRVLNDTNEKLAEGVDAQPISPSADVKDLEEMGFAQLYVEDETKPKQ